VPARFRGSKLLRLSLEEGQEQCLPTGARPDVGVPSRHVRLWHWRWREWELGRVTDFVLRNTVWEWPSMKSDPRACRAGKYREVAQSPVPNIWRDHRSRRRNLENVSAKAPTLIYLLFAFLVLVTAGDSCCGSR
jgi:hypothetical protein